MDRSTGRIVALKKVLMHKETEGFPLLAMREIRLLSQLNHENVLRLEETVHSEPMTTWSRRTLIAFCPVLPEHITQCHTHTLIYVRMCTLVCVCVCVCSGLHYLDVNKVMHRDLKVANVLLNRKGILKIADFGLSRYMDKNNRYTLPVCTRWYRPPEVLLGDKRYSQAIDIWSGACIIAELFTGRPTFQGGVVDARTEQDNEIDQFLLICETCGTPREESWPEYTKLPHASFIVPKKRYPRRLKERLGSQFLQKCASGLALLDDLLVMNPSKRPTAGTALDHHFFWEDPMPCLPSQIRDLGPECHEDAKAMLERRKPPPRRRPRDTSAPGAPPPPPPQQQNGRPSAPPAPAAAASGQRGQPLMSRRPSGHHAPRPPSGHTRAHVQPRQQQQHPQQHQRGSSGGRHQRHHPRPHQQQQQSQQAHRGGGRHAHGHGHPAGAAHHGSKGSKHLPQHYRHGPPHGNPQHPHGRQPHPAKRPKMQQPPQQHQQHRRPPPPQPPHGGH
ncbi:CMGC/CDK protein kinase [Salpingoeca rosetta]|uniref:CMGC/CDK protein kinase n=1 Tax=Salpingoeca rosetta (strain ATCC 50818 / BSB-021) TaxID=946362 RepID=F2UE59_SALR5|nr:CMGC/CDK protein kinase [Salpingoeca rosetta]EGD74909.1 CMGC/CDK protein kinase [Salpingoeca rosetta]|eukprot:XP_004992554.1 CMGC/CDK protein kinase [Salpingoeca rosetta]